MQKEGTIGGRKYIIKKLDMAGQNVSYDAYCRNLLIDKQSLARILKTCVKEFHDCPVKDIEERYIEGKPKAYEAAYNMLSVIAVCLGGTGDEKYEGLLRMLDVLLSDKILPGEKKKILKAEFDVAMTKTMEREAMEMCNLSQGIVDRTTINHMYHMMLQDKMEVSHV